MKELGIQQVYDHVNGALAEKNYPLMSQLLWPALDQFPNDPVLLHFAAHLFTVENKLVPALLCAMKANELEPTGANYTNLGSIFRRLNMVEESHAALIEAVGYEPKNKHPWNNLAAAHCNEGNPLPGIAAADEALRLDPDFDKARWNRGLLLLESGNFADGFDDYRAGLTIGERLLKTYAEDPEQEPQLVSDLEVLKKWRHDNGKRPRLIVWGEQGLGDEIMFSTIFPDLAEDAEIIYDCHPRMHDIMTRSYGYLCKEIYPTRKLKGADWYKDTPPCQFKCSIGDIARWYRRSLDAFTHAKIAEAPWIVPNAAESAKYRANLEDLAPGKKYVGFAWTGGILSTQRWYRCCQLPELAPMLMHPDIQPVSLQYEDDAAPVQAFYEDTDKLVYRFPGITEHFDMDHTLALIDSLDAVVTVCQTVAHLAAAAGKQTFVLTPDKPAWRYGLTSKEWFWYENSALYRRPADQWEPAVIECTLDLYKYLRLNPMENVA